LFYNKRKQLNIDDDIFTEYIFDCYFIDTLMALIVLRGKNIICKL